ncbi:MAG: MBL fold metallo-hydrolase [Deltaproteobacteria bacterium]|nr:MBL fold metallo-hydrolase [Deltaproteobacteria bacterium]
MKVHHLNCATLCPPAPGPLLNPERKMVCHCLLVETRDGLVLIDTGLGLDDVARPRARLGGTFVLLVGPKLDAAETAARQVEALGFQRKDVRHIVPTHLDLDHAGGLSDFPDAEVHVHDPEITAALKPLTRLERERYRAAQWAHGPRWDRRKLEGDHWFGFEAVRAVPGLGDEVLIVPTAGHTRGHAAIAVRTGDTWLLHCGDAYFYRGEMDPDRRRVTPLLDIFQRIVQVEGEARVRNQERLRILAREHAAQVRVMCAHDPLEFERFAHGAAPR